DGYKIENVFQGEAMTEVLKYVNYDAEVLQDQLAARIADSDISSADALRLQQLYKQLLSSYTYLGSE
ncbi:MAG: hypothetical protein JKY56_14480, partial [Kofleriaceae bacterium]|nr:hypothetical protein [Kofleriaceae bacterium]